jgi:putative transposase
MTFESRFSEADIERILGEYGAGANRRELCARYGISVRTLFRWNARKGRNRPALLKLVTSLHEENARLRELLHQDRPASPAEP